LADLYENVCDFSPKPAVVWFSMTGRGKVKKNTFCLSSWFLVQHC